MSIQSILASYKRDNVDETTDKKEIHLYTVKESGKIIVACYSLKIASMSWILI